MFSGVEDISHGIRSNARVWQFGKSSDLRNYWKEALRTDPPTPQATYNFAGSMSDRYVESSTAIWTLNLYSLPDSSKKSPDTFPR
jgi:hypothetical protein